MKKTNKVQNNDVDFLELFKKSLALSFTVFLFGVQQSYANNNITPGGNYGTQIEGGTSNNTNITGGTINNGTGFHHFDQFQVGQGGTANLIFAEGANRYVNMVNNQVSIYGIFNALKGGNIGGDVIFVSPGGLIVGSSGIMNVGSLQTITPSLTDYNRVLGTTNLSDITSLLSNSTSSSTRIDGKIFAKDSINIADGRSVTINKNADIVAGFNENGFDKSRLQGFKMSDIVNESGIVDSAYMTEGAGNISIVANSVNTSGVSDGSAHIIQSSGDITIDTPKVGDIGVITSGSKIYANGDVNIGNDAAQSGTGTVLIEQDVTALGNVNIKAMANIAQEADVTAGKNINIKADIYNQTKDTVTTSTDGGTINIDGAAKLGRVINKNGNIEIKAATNSDLTFQNTVTAEDGSINVSSTSGNILQADDTFDALQTKNGGTLSIRTYGPSMSIGSQSQALNLDVDGAVDISSVRGISHLNSNNSTLTLGNISGVSTLDAQSKKDISIKDNIEVGGEINLRAEEGINQQSGSITSTGSGNIDINNGASGAINVGNITNYDGDINIENQAEGEKLTISQRLEATGDINISSNAGIEQTDSSYISSTANGNISMTNNTQGDLIVGNVSSSNGEITIDNKAEEGSVTLKQNISSVKDVTVLSKGGILQQNGSTISINGAGADANIINQGKGDISISNITNANGNIVIKNAIDETTDPELAGNVNINGNLQADNGYVDISSQNNIVQTGSITANGVNSSESVKISAANLANLNSITAKNGIQIDADSVTLNNLVQSTEGGINISANGDITQTISGKSLDAKGDINLVTSENGDIGKLAGETTQEQSIALNSEGTVSLIGGNINVSSPDKDVTFGSVQAKNNISLSTTASSVPVPGGNITFNDSVSGEKITINSVKDIDINSNITSSGGMQITAKEGINQGDSSSLINNTSGSIKLDNTDSGNINTTTITNNGSDIEVTNSAVASDDSGKINLNGVYTTNSGKVSISAQNDIVQNESIEKAIIAGGNVSLESIEGSIGTDTRFITMQTQSPISAKAAEGSVYLKAIGSDLKLTDDSEIVFGKDIGLASDKTVIIEKSDGITASDGSIYIDSNGLFNLDKNLTAKNYIEIKGANGINQQSNSTLTTTGTGDGIGNINIINAGASSGQGKGVVNINNINSTGKVSIKSDNVRTDSNKLTINSGASIQASKGIDIASGTGINQNAGSSIINTDSGNINITNTVGESNIGRVINQNGDITISSSTNNGNVKFNDEVNAQNGDITVKSNTYIVQNSAEAILKAGNNINLSSNFDTGAADSALKVNSGGKVNSTGRGIYLESPDMDINTGTITASRDVNIKTTGASGALTATGLISGQNVVINAVDSIMQDEALDLAINATGNINLTAQNGNIGSSSGTGNLPNRLDVASGGIVTASASKGEININSVNKNITFGNIISAGDINLSSSGNAGQITTNSTLQADNGSINIDSSKNIILNNKVSALNDVNLKAQTGIKHTAGEMSSATGNVNITNAASGDIILKNVTASDGNITISAENSTGDISLTGKLTALSSDTTNGVVTINSGRNLSQTGTDSGISAQNSIHLSSKTGSIGKSDTDNIKINIENTDGLLTADAENGSIYVQTADKDLNLGSISAKDNVSLKTTGSSGNINIKDTITGGNLTLNSVENIEQASDETSLISSGTIILNALGNVGSNSGSSIDSIKVSADGNVSGDAENFYVESLEKDLKTGVINSQGKIYLNASGADASVILNGLAKANDVEIIANKNIQQDSTLEKAIESSTDVSLTALNGNIGEPKTETVTANAIDLSAGGRITASASQGSVIINGVESNIQTDNITAKNDIDLTTTTSGKITVTNDLITDTGYIRLDSAEDLVISNNIQAKGDVILEAQNGISQTDGNIGSTGSGNILVTNNERNDISLKKLTTADGNINITNNALNANVILNDVVTSGAQGTITIGSQGNIEQTFDSTALISSGDIMLNAKGNVGKLDGEDVKFIKVSTDGNVSGSGQKFYVESPDKDLALGNITATDDVILKSTATDKSVILNGLVKGNEVSVIADKNIYQNGALEKSIEAVTDVILVAQHGDIGEAAGTGTEANAIDLTAGGTIAASAAEGSVIINGVKSNIVTDNITAKNNIDLTTTQSGKITVSNDLVTDTGYIRLNSAQDLEIANNITANGNVILVANDGIIQSDGLIQSSGSGKVLIQNYNAGDISIKDVLSKSGGIDVINSAVGGDVILNTTISTTNNGDIFIEANRDIIQNFVGDAISAGADVRLVSVTGDIGKSNNYINLKVLPDNKVDASAAQGSVNLNSNAQDIHFGTIEAGQNINLSTTESGKIYLDNDLTTNGGSVKLDSAENLEIQKNITASGNIVLNANPN
ncbi:MAG: leukotoxin LktA family filamentous adhesin [Clostridium sp.]|nr:leukotoxin LktA family filamentous adhesin [Clostridium sp.]